MEIFRPTKPIEVWEGCDCRRETKARSRGHFIPPCPLPIEVDPYVLTKGNQSNAPNSERTNNARRPTETRDTPQIFGAAAKIDAWYGT